MYRQYVFTIMVVICLVLTACGGNTTPKPDVASEIVKEEGLSENQINLEGDATSSTEEQPVQFPTPDSALSDPDNAKLRYLLSNVQLAKTEDGWSHYYVSAAVQNLSSEFLNVDHEAEEPIEGMTYYYLPGFEAFGTVETQEGNTYNVFPAFDLICDTGIGTFMGHGAWSFMIPPEAVIAKSSFGCMGLYYKVPETLHPIRLVLSLGGQMKETFDIGSILTSQPPVHNSFSQAVTLPVTYQIGPFELTFGGQVLLREAEYGKQAYYIKGQLKNTDMTADSEWEYSNFEVFGISELGEDIELETYLLCPEGPCHRFPTFGPGQSEEVALDFSPFYQYQFPEEAFYWFFYHENQWKVFKVDLPAQ